MSQPEWLINLLLDFLGSIKENGIQTFKKSGAALLQNKEGRFDLRGYAVMLENKNDFVFIGQRTLRDSTGIPETIEYSKINSCLVQKQ